VDLLIIDIILGHFVKNWPLDNYDDDVVDDDDDPSLINDKIHAHTTHSQYTFTPLRQQPVGGQTLVVFHGHPVHFCRRQYFTYRIMVRNVFRYLKLSGSDQW